MLETFLKNQIEDIDKKNIKLKIIGTKSFSSELNNLLKLAEKKTFNNTRLQVNLALNYGSKFEIVNAIKQLSKSKSKINEKNFINFLETKGMPDPDLLIRTGNTKRLSNFFLWQLAYTEIFFEKKLWPEFNEKDFNRVIEAYKKTKRNFGKVI